MADQNSPFSELILQIQDRIKAQVPIIRMIDEDKGQLEDVDEKSGKPPVSWPCLLIDFPDATFDELGDDISQVEAEVILRLGFPPYSLATSWFPKDVKVNALKYFDIEHDIYAALHGWEAGNLGSMICRKARTERRNDGIRVRELRYEVVFCEYSAQPVKDIQKIPPTLEVSEDQEE